MSLRKISIYAVLLALLVASFGLVGYLPGLGFLGSIQKNFIPMAPSTAISFIIQGLIALGLIIIKKRSIVVAITFLVLASLTANFGLLEVPGFFIEVDLNLEDSIFPPAGELNGIPVARMSPFTGILFFLSGLSLVALSIRSLSDSKEDSTLAGILGSLVFMASIVAIIGYLIGTPLLYGSGATVPMALTTAIAFFFLSISIVLLSGRDSVPVRYFIGSSTRARLLRTFIPLATLAVLVGNITTQILPALLGVNPVLVFAITSVVIMIITALLVSWISIGVGRSIDKAENDRRKAQESDRLKSVFLATMSHELRTPLNSIIGFTGLVLGGMAGPLEEEQKKQLSMVRDSSRHLLNLINDVLDISKIEADQIEIISERFDVNESIDEAIKTVMPLAEYKGLKLRTEIRQDIGLIKSDQRRICQILINLLNNAIKFTDEGEIVVESRFEKGWLKISVRDTGIGIRRGDLDKLFKSFQRIDSGLGRVDEGTGLGLSISKKLLVEKLGGEISVESVWGKGSTFTLSLPAEEESEAA